MEAIQEEKKPVVKEKKEKLILNEARIKDMTLLFEYDEQVLRGIMQQQQMDIQKEK